MKIQWSRTAYNQLKAIHDYIGLDSKRHANRTVEQITEKAERLASNPFIGSVVPEFETLYIREVLFKSFRIIYHVGESVVSIVGVVHAARELSRNLLDKIAEQD